jgi:hypothetical protein
MLKRLISGLNPSLIFSSIFSLTLITGLSVKSVSAQSRPYNPIPLEIGREITDKLSNQDVPTGQGGFSRDYGITLKPGEQVSIEAKSQAFDTIVSLIAPGGTTLAENDDGPDGTDNSLLFARVVKPGNYVVRVRSFGERPGGIFTLKVTRLRSE